MEYLVFLGAGMVFYYLIKGKEELAYLNVIIPGLFLLPNSFQINLGSLPIAPITFYISAVFVLSLYLLIFRLDKIQFNKIDALILIYIVMDLAIDLYKGNKIGYSIKGFQIRLFEGYILYFVSKYFFQKKIIIKKTIDILIICCLLLLIVAPYEMFTGDYIIKYFWKSTIPFLKQAMRWDIHRLQLFFSHPIIAGTVYSIIAYVSILLAINTEKDKKKYTIFSLLAIAGIICSISRGPFLILCFFIFAYSVFKMKKRFKLILLISVGVVFLNLYSKIEIDSSWLYRWNLLTNINELIGESIWIGYGENIKYTGDVGHAWGGASIMSIDNFYLFKIFSNGILSLCLFLLIIFVTTIYWIKVTRSHIVKMYDKLYASLAMAIVIIILLNYIFVANMFHTDIILYIGISILSASYDKLYVQKEDKNYNFQRIL